MPTPAGLGVRASPHHGDDQETHHPMTRSIDQISFDALTPGVRDNTRTCPTCSGVGVLTATDLFCGAGGSSLGLEKVRCPSCGRSLIEVKYALNHWDLAIQAHNANFPKADHAINGAGEVAPSIFGFTDLGWFSPECTNYSSAKGAKDNSEQAIRSRATFNDIIRFVGHWKYSAVFVENVVEARLWCDERGHDPQCRCGATFNRWYLQLLNLGYDGEIVYFNSQFAYPTPQSRDRMYVVFWRRGLDRPNVDFTPPSWCSHCEAVVPGVQTWKKASKGSVRALDGLFKWGRYGTQYIYNCPTCANPVAPAVTGAKTIIDWSLPARKIGERSRPLAPNTMRRIRKGLEYIANHRPMTVQVGGNLYERDGYARVWAVDDPLKTLTATNELALVTPAGSLEANARDAGRPMHSLTGSDRLALTFRARGQSVAPAAASEPMTTITAHDRQRAVLVQAGGTTGSGRNPRGADEPLGTLTGENHRAVVVPTMAHNTSRAAEEPVPAVTGGNRHMLVQVTHAGERRIRTLQEPAPTIAGHGELGIVSMRNHGLTTQGGEPVSTLTAGGYHHGAIMYNGTPGFVREVGDSAGTVTCRNAQSLLVPYYTNGNATSTNEPAATISTKDREALVITDEEIDACQFRMLTWPELLRAQVMHELPDGSPYLLTARQRKASGKMAELSNENRVRMIGNAVSAPVATMLGYAVVKVLAGDSLSLAA
jgi:DNA (cytosine-5)-methyltransferase 1